MPLHIPFQITDWSHVEATAVPGTTGEALIRTVQYDDLRIRQVLYSPGYEADHWCTSGHLAFVLEGELINELQGGTSTVMKAGTFFAVSDGLSSHRVRSLKGATVLVVDGGFLG